MNQYIHSRHSRQTIYEFGLVSSDLLVVLSLGSMIHDQPSNVGILFRTTSFWGPGCSTILGYPRCFVEICGGPNNSHQRSNPSWWPFQSIEVFARSILLGVHLQFIYIYIDMASQATQSLSLKPYRSKDIHQHLPNMTGMTGFHRCPKFPLVGWWKEQFV